MGWEWLKHAIETSCGTSGGHRDLTVLILHVAKRTVLGNCLCVFPQVDSKWHLSDISNLDLDLTKVGCFEIFKFCASGLGKSMMLYGIFPLALNIGHLAAIREVTEVLIQIATASRIHSWISLSMRFQMRAVFPNVNTYQYMLGDLNSVIYHLATRKLHFCDGHCQLRFSFTGLKWHVHRFVDGNAGEISVLCRVCLQMNTWFTVTVSFFVYQFIFLVGVYMLIPISNQTSVFFLLVKSIRILGGVNPFCIFYNMCCFLYCLGIICGEIPKFHGSIPMFLQWLKCGPPGLHGAMSAVLCQDWPSVAVPRSF